MHDLYTKVVGQVQFGPVYRCFVCGEKVSRLIPYVEHRQGATFLDRFADHLAYLDLAPPCKSARHPARVAGPRHPRRLSRLQRGGLGKGQE